MVVLVGTSRCSALGTSVIIHWVKGHNNIQGNDIADRSANLAHKNNRSEVFHLTETEQISLLKLIKMHVSLETVLGTNLK